MSFTESDLIVAGLHGPYIGHTPGGDDFDVRRKGADAELEADLVIAFACGSMADGDRVFLAGDFYQTAGNSRPCHGGSEQIFVLINCSGLYTRHDKFVTEFVHDIFNIQFGGSRKTCPFFQTVQFIALPAVHAAADNIIAEGFLEPGDECCGIKAARVGEYDFFLHMIPPDEMIVYLFSTFTDTRITIRIASGDGFLQNVRCREMHK